MVDAPRFLGDPADLAAFQALVDSPIRSPAREQALQAWAAHKLRRQMAWQRGAGAAAAGGKSGAWTKDAYMACLTAPAIDLRGACFHEACIGYADLRGARLNGACFDPGARGWTGLKGAQLAAAHLAGARLPAARLMGADLGGADLRGAVLAGADLSDARLHGADLSGADLRDADLSRANLVGACIDGAWLDGARVHGVAAWDLRGEPASSAGLRLGADGASLTVDDIRVAQFLYLLLSNPRVRDVLDTVTRKVVLLLGRFSAQRKPVLDALREALRAEGFVPVLFDFAPSDQRDLTETVTLLARLARFVVADLSDPASVPQELQAIAPQVAVPIRLIIQADQQPYAMARDLAKYPWVIAPYRYQGPAELLAALRTEVVDAAEARRAQLARTREAGADGW